VTGKPFESNEIPSLGISSTQLERGQAMNRDFIERWQAATIGKSLCGKLYYLLRLRQRMDKSAFWPNDPYYLLVCRA
jgi:hypothetical protein